MVKRASFVIGFGNIVKLIKCASLKFNEERVHETPGISSTVLRTSEGQWLL
jgi:hypothetical protein